MLPAVPPPFYQESGGHCPTPAWAQNREAADNLLISAPTHLCGTIWSENTWMSAAAPSKK